MIKQVGNKVFKEVTVAGHRFIVQFLAEHGLTPHGIRRFWLHQANARMNAMILKLAFGHEVDHDRAPMVLRAARQHGGGRRHHRAQGKPRGHGGQATSA